MFCIAGLGNPGIQYQETRHNAGFLVIERIAEKSGIAVNKKGFQSMYGKGVVEGNELFLVKPQTFMNLSGQAVSALLAYFKLPLERILVVYDDLDLPLGKLRFRLSGSSGGHKGMASIIEAIGSSDIPRLRVGIGRPPDNQDVVDYVLKPFCGPEKEIFSQSIERAAEAATFFVTKGPGYVANHLS